MRLQRLMFGGVVLSTLTAVFACGRSLDKTVLRPAIHAAIQASPERAPKASKADRDLSRLVQQWYEARDYRLAWDDDGDAKLAVAVLLASTSHGLNPDWYGPSQIEAARVDRRRSKAQDATRVQELATFDVLVSTALIHAGRDVATGHVRPEFLNEKWKSGRTPPDLVATLNDAVEGGKLDGWLDRIAPPHAEYRQLRDWLAARRQRPGADPADPHVAQIAANLERLRWLPDDLGERHLIVNIPEFMLRAREQTKTVLEMRVVVGKPDGHETPVISGDLESVVFNPYWNLPNSIVLAETLPAIAKDRDYLERHDMEVLRISAKGSKHVDPDDVDWDDPKTLKELRIRQRPGDDNSLGEFKFPFRNEQAIYLHDTPSKALFAKESRAFSHGCVRVSEPAELARYLLSSEGPEWTSEKIADAVKGNEESHIPVATNVPVHLVYLTVVADTTGEPRYLADIYGFDRKQMGPQ